jgi:hypothetical protein
LRGWGRIPSPGMNPWLGARRGFLSDWTTQQWVRATGKRIEFSAAPWLRGPCAPPTGLRETDFARYAADEGLSILPDSGEVGLLDDVAALRSERFDPAHIRPEIAHFYERTARYRLHLWSQWSPIFRPFGKAVDTIFARRVGQLQLPLAPLDTSRGISSQLIRLRGRDGEPRPCGCAADSPAGRSPTPASTQSRDRRSRLGVA